MSKEAPKVNYDDVLAELAADEVTEITVKVGGKSFPVTRPNRLEYFKQLIKSQKGEIDSEDLAVEMVKSMLPSKNLTNEQVFNIMLKDGFFSGQGELFDATEKFGKLLDPKDAFEAGKSSESDENF